MAINSNISIGEGIGLQGAPNMYENIAMEQLKYKRDKEARKKKEDEEVLNRWRGNLKIEGYMPAYNKGIAVRSAKVINKLNQLQNLKQLHLADSDPEILKYMNDLQIYSGNAKKATAVFNDAMKFSAEHAKDYQGNQDIINIINKANEAGDVTPEFAQVFGGNGFGVDPSKIYSPKAPEEINYQERVAKVFSPFAERQAKKAGDAYIDPSTGNIITPRTTTFTIEQAKDVIAGDLADPKIREQAVKDFNRLSSADKEKYGDPENFYKEKYAPQLVVEDKTSSLTKPSEGGLGKKKIESIINDNFDQVIGGGKSSAGLSGRTGSTTMVYGQTGLKEPLPFQITIPEGTVNTKNNNSVSTSVTDKNGTIGSTPGVKPILTENTPYGRVGDIVTRDMIAKARHGGYDILSKINFSPMVSVSAKVTNPILDKSGKPTYKPNESGKLVQAFHEEEGSFELPLNSGLKSIYETNGYDIGSIYEKKASEMNSRKGYYIDEMMKSYESSSGKNSTRTPVTQYSNIRAARVGGVDTKIGVKDGKWYDINTGKEIK